MAEEHGFQEGHRLCANNCGFVGSPTTMDLCSKCYRDLCMKEQASSPKEKLVFVSSSSASPLSSPVLPPVEPTRLTIEPDRVTEPNRCSACRKRVGLTGFRCRCGCTFCPTHRYPECHGCEFDFKKAGREAIARENPVVKGKKLDKI